MGDFAIDEGTLTFSTTPNFESAADEDTNNVYMVTVEASDGTVKGTLAVTITVTNVNEKPSFTETSPVTRSVAEMTATGQDIGNPVEAEDPDSGDHPVLLIGYHQRRIFRHRLINRPVVDQGFAGQGGQGELHGHSVSPRQQERRRGGRCGG